jgi:hypothetical protein
MRFDHSIQTVDKTAELRHPNHVIGARRKILSAGLRIRLADFFVLMVFTII